MAKLKKRKLKWQASISPQVIGYKLYWTENGNVDYGSNHAFLGNVTEIVLPDEVDSFKPGDDQLEFGITSVDELGNESDFITLKAPYQFSVPKAPTNFEILKPGKVSKKTEPIIDTEKMEAIEIVEVIAKKQNQDFFSTNSPKKGSKDDLGVNDFLILDEDLKVEHQ